ncbi:MAG: IPT/TIG domain-containing protein, partial [Verrucomicrobiota bacterium]
GGTNTTGTNFFVAPSITAWAPEQGIPGAPVVLTGVNFLGATEVRFGGTPAAFTVDSNVRISAVVPAGAVSGPIQVVAPGGTQATVRSFQVLGEEPVITGFAPSSGPPGTQVQVRGFNLAGASAVRFGGVAAPQFSEAGGTNLTTRVPSGAVTGPISVTTSRGTGVSTNSFVVGTTADVRLTLASGPASPAYGGQVTLTARAENVGPLPAEAVLVFLELPAGLDFRSASVSQGSPETLGRTVTFRSGTVPPGTVVTAVVQAVVASFSPLSVVAEAVSDIPDPSPGNNAASVVVQPSRPVLNLAREPGGRWLLSWPAEPTNLVAEGSWQLADRPWVAVPGPWEEAGGQRRATVAATNALEFFRLRLGP